MTAICISRPPLKWRVLSTAGFGRNYFRRLGQIDSTNQGLQHRINIQRQPYLPRNRQPSTESLEVVISITFMPFRALSRFASVSFNVIIDRLLVVETGIARQFLLSFPRESSWRDPGSVLRNEDRGCSRGELCSLRFVVMRVEGGEVVGCLWIDSRVEIEDFGKPALFG